MPRRRHRTSLDRIGWALTVEAIAGGLAALLSAAVGVGGGEPPSLALAFVGGAFVTLGSTVAIGLPLWLVVRRRADGPLAAAVLGGAIGWLLLVVGQLGAAGGALMLRWISATTTATLLVPVPALLALLAWRVAYRPVDALRRPGYRD